LLHARERRSRGVHLAEGRKVVGEALRVGRVRELLFVAEHEDIARAHPDVPSTLVGDAVMRRLSDAVTPPGIVGVVTTPESDAALPPGGPVLVLHRLNDPGNVGTLIRSAAALGAHSVIVTGDAADPFGPKAVRASAGSCYHVPVLRRSDLDAAVAELRAAALEPFGLAASGGREIATLTGRTDVALVLGSEAHGLGVSASDMERVRIPMAREVESLNVAAAGAIALHVLSVHPPV
jgi:TrmH family RNA methyltransferase